MMHDEVETAIRNATGLFRATVVEHALYRAAYVAGMRAAADHAEQSWRDGYRGEVNSGFAITIRAAADRIEQEPTC